MRRLWLTLAALLVALPAGTTSASPPSPPTPAQIHSAVRAAKRSRSMWATVNVCGSAGTLRAFGIRGQMPGLGFTTTMYMTFVVYYLGTDGQTRVVPGTRKTALVAQGSNRLFQSGVTFNFSPPATLSAKVTFVWKRNGRPLGHAVRLTTANHHHADHGSPPGYSTAQCTLS